VAKIRAIEDTRIEHLAIPLGLYRKVAEAIGDALGRPVEDFPVDQPARAAWSDRARPNAAKGERNLPGFLALVDEWRRFRHVRKSSLRRYLSMLRQGVSHRSGGYVHEAPLEDRAHQPG